VFSLLRKCNDTCDILRANFLIVLRSYIAVFSVIHKYSNPICFCYSTTQSASQQCNRTYIRCYETAYDV